MLMYLPMSSCIVGIDDLALRPMTFGSCSLTTSVASYTMSSSLIYKKERDTREKKGDTKRGISQDTNLCCQTITCLLNDFWVCWVPIQAKRIERQPHLQSGLQVLTSLADVRVPKLDPKKSQ